MLASSDVRSSLAELAALGVRRVSVGSALARVAWTAFLRAAEAPLRDGRLDAFAALTPYAELEAFFRGSPGASREAPERWPRANHADRANGTGPASRALGRRAAVGIAPAVPAHDCQHVRALGRLRQERGRLQRG